MPDSALAAGAWRAAATKGILLPCVWRGRTKTGRQKSWSSLGSAGERESSHSARKHVRAACRLCLGDRGRQCNRLRTMSACDEQPQSQSHPASCSTDGLGKQQPHQAETLPSLLGGQSANPPQLEDGLERGVKGSRMEEKEEASPRGTLQEKEVIFLLVPS